MTERVCKSHGGWWWLIYFFVNLCRNDLNIIKGREVTPNALHPCIELMEGTTATIITLTTTNDNYHHSLPSSLSISTNRQTKQTWWGQWSTFVPDLVVKTFNCLIEYVLHLVFNHQLRELLTNALPDDLLEDEEDDYESGSSSDASSLSSQEDEEADNKK